MFRCADCEHDADVRVKERNPRYRCPACDGQVIHTTLAVFPVAQQLYRAGFAVCEARSERYPSQVAGAEYVRIAIAFMRGYSTSVFDNAPDGFEYTNHPQNKLRKGWLRYCEDATSYRQLTGDLSGADAEHALLRVLSEWATTLDPATVKAAELPTLER